MEKIEIGLENIIVNHEWKNLEFVDGNEYNILKIKNKIIDFLENEDCVLKSLLLKENNIIEILVSNIDNKEYLYEIEVTANSVG
jgi:hypothetical protein